MVIVVSCVLLPSSTACTAGALGLQRSLEERPNLINRKQLSDAHAWRVLGLTCCADEQGLCSMLSAEGERVLMAGGAIQHTLKAVFGKYDFVYTRKQNEFNCNAVGYLGQHVTAGDLGLPLQSDARESAFTQLNHKFTCISDAAIIVGFVQCICRPRLVHPLRLHMHTHKAQVLSRYKELLKLIQRLPAEQAAVARSEAQQTIRQRRQETDREAQLQHLKELVARISFLRITTPRPVGEKLEAGSYVLREGELVKGAGEDKGARYPPSCYCSLQFCCCMANLSDLLHVIMWAITHMCSIATSYY